MKRRLTLARALVNDPDIIFLDEPTTGLDPQARHLIWERLKRLMVGGKTLILTTHFMDEAERLCDRLAILDHGGLIAEGAPRELIASHIEPQVVEIFGEAPPPGPPPARASASASRWPATPPSSTATTPRRCSCRAGRRKRRRVDPALRPSRGQPRGRLPQADRARPPRLGSCATRLLCPAPPRPALAAGVAAQLPGLAQAGDPLDPGQPRRPPDLHARPRLRPRRPAAAGGGWTTCASSPPARSSPAP
jgi:hypothetical protein